MRLAAALIALALGSCKNQEPRLPPLTDEVKTDFAREATCTPVFPGSEHQFVCIGDLHNIRYWLMDEQRLKYLSVHLVALGSSDADETFASLVKGLVGEHVFAEIRERLWSSELSQGRLVWKSRAGYAVALSLTDGEFVLQLGAMSPNDLAEIDPSSSIE
jgi:hypothetical protein